MKRYNLTNEKINEHLKYLSLREIAFMKMFSEEKFERVSELEDGQKFRLSHHVVVERTE